MTFPETELPDVADAVRAVRVEAKDAGVWVFSAGLEHQVPSVVATDGTVTDGTVTDGPYPETKARHAGGRGFAGGTSYELGATGTTSYDVPAPTTDHRDVRSQTSQHELTAFEHFAPPVGAAPSLTGWADAWLERATRKCPSGSRDPTRVGEPSAGGRDLGRGDAHPGQPGVHCTRTSSGRPGKRGQHRHERFHDLHHRYGVEPRP